MNAHLHLISPRRDRGGWSNERKVAVVLWKIHIRRPAVQVRLLLVERLRPQDPGGRDLVPHHERGARADKVEGGVKMTHEIFFVFLSVLCFGALGGTAFASAQGFTAFQIILLIISMNILVAIFWFSLIGLLARKFRKYLSSQRPHVWTYSTLALVSFTTGSNWGALISYAVNARVILAFGLVTVSCLASSIPLCLASLGIINFGFISPWWLYFAAVLVTAFHIGRIFVRNRSKVVATISAAVRRQ